MFRLQCAAMAAALVLIPAGLAAAPFVPENDSVVLERLPEKGDPALAQLKRMRAALMSNPRDLDFAIPVARRALEAARTLGDPRFLGQAQAALAPWWKGRDVPPAALLLRATLKQSQHDFEGSLADLDRLLAAHPTQAQARLTRATVFGVVGRYADARRDCAQLAGRVSPMVVAGCEATPASLSGDAAAAYDALAGTLADPREHAGVREWALTLAAEIAARRGDWTAAERHFKDALALDPGDAYLKGAYADYLLDRDRPREVLPLVRNDTRNDALLLRLALAEQRLPDQRASFVAHREDLAERFDAARRRGDSLHRREEARFRLTIENDADAALVLARDNWAVQREPADLRILIESARATRNADALKIASDWIAANRLEDAVTLAALGASQ
jgi:predicted Zn-dependent protease